MGLFSKLAEDKKNHIISILFMVVGIISIVQGLRELLSYSVTDEHSYEVAKVLRERRVFRERSLTETPLKLIRDVFDFPTDPSDKSLLWYVPRNGDASIQEIVSQCHLPQLIDTSTTEGIEQVITSKLAGNEVGNLIISSFFFEASKIMTEEFKGRAFTFMRDPIEREFAHYAALKQNNHLNMMLEGYVASEYSGNNMMMRRLIGKEKGNLTIDDYETAKLILREKCFVLLTDEIEESFDRWSQLNHGTQIDDAEWSCIGDMIVHVFTKGKDISLSQYSVSERNLLYRANTFDVKLYQYAKYLFLQQGMWFKEHLHS